MVDYSPVLEQVPKVEVKKYNGKYIAESDQGELQVDTIPDTVIQTAINQTGDVYISAGQYTLSNAFTGFTIPSGYLKISMDKNCSLNAANGFSGAFFTIDSTSAAMSRKQIEGGRIAESGTPQRLWTGIKLKSVANGIYSCTFKDIEIYDANIGIDSQNTAATGWNNGNEYENIKIFNPNIGIQFTQLSTLVSNGQAFNNFKFCQIQSAANTTTGVKDISGQSHTFLGCIVWDIGANVSSNITAQATDIQIFGGAMTQTANWRTTYDLGTRTLAIDAYQGVYVSARNIVTGFSRLKDNGSLLQVRNAADNAYDDIQLGNLWTQSGGIIKSNALQVLGFSAAQGVMIGKSAPATTATDGFPYIPANAGAPTGVPTAQTGFVPMYYDTTNHKIWIYDGAWKGVVVA